MKTLPQSVLILAFKIYSTEALGYHFTISILKYWNINMYLLMVYIYIYIVHIQLREEKYSYSSFRQSASGYLPHLHAPHLKLKTSVNLHFMTSIRFCMTDNIARQVTNWSECTHFRLFSVGLLLHTWFFILYFKFCTSRSQKWCPML